MPAERADFAGQGQADLCALSDVARRVVWFRPPEETLKDETFFLNHVMIHGLADDIVRAGGILATRPSGTPCATRIRESGTGGHGPSGISPWT